MRSILISSLCIVSVNLWALDGSATALALATIALPPPAVKIESCSLEPHKVAAVAARKGYVSSTKLTAGAADCSIDRTGTILVVSAGALDAGTCTFSLFAPPTPKRLTVVRIALKAASDGSTQYIQRGADLLHGLSIPLSAGPGQTVQFRIAGVEVDPVNNQCLIPILEDAL